MSSIDFGVGGDRTKFAIVSLVGTAAVTVVLAGVHWSVAGGTGAGAGIEGMALILGDLLQLVSIAAFGIWLHRAYSNVAALRRSTRYGANTAVAFFYLPFVSFFLPQAILQEIWTKSRAEDPRAKSRPLPAGHPPWFEMWWYLFIVFSALYNFGGALALETDHPSSSATKVLFLAAILGVIVAYLGADMILRIDHRQRTSSILVSLPGQSHEAAPPGVERRSAVRDLLMPIVSMVEEEQASVDEAGPHIPAAVLRTQEIAREAARAASAGLVRWARRPFFPPLRQFDFSTVMVSLLAAGVQFCALLQVIVCFLFVVPRVPRNTFIMGQRPEPELLVVVAFIGPLALLEYLAVAAAWIGWKFFDWTAAQDEALERLRRAAKRAKIACAAILVLALVMPAKYTLIGVAIANVCIILAGRALRLAAFSVAWERSGGRQAALPGGDEP